MQEEAIINKKNTPCITYPTPQEKAIELVDKFKLLLNCTFTASLQCAIIAANEAKKCTKYENQKFENDRFSEDYWELVEQKLNKYYNTLVEQKNNEYYNSIL